MWQFFRIFYTFYTFIDIRIRNIHEEINLIFLREETVDYYVISTDKRNAYYIISTFYSQSVGLSDD